MTVLAVDQGYDFCSVALQHKGHLVFKNLQFESNRLTSRLTTSLIDVIQDLCRECNTEVGAIKIIASTIGPASFTGLRVVLATLQGIAFAHQAQVFTCTRLALRAFIAFQRSDPFLAIYESRLSNHRGAYYTQSFTRNGNLPCAMNAVTLSESGQEEAGEGSAPYLLEWVKKAPLGTAGDATHLMPFYGHTPEFKKKFP